MAHSIPSHEGHGNSQGAGVVKWRSRLSLGSDRAAWPPTRAPPLTGFITLGKSFTFS